MPKVYCNVEKCKYNTTIRILGHKKNRIRLKCTKRTIHLSDKGLCLDFKGKKINVI